MVASKQRRRRVLRVVIDDAFREELRQAGDVTGIRGASDLVRFAIRQIVRGAKEKSE